MSPSPSATGGLPTDFVSLPWGGVDWPDIQNQCASIDRSVDAMKCEKRRSGKQHFGPSINASPIPSLPLPALLPFPPSLLPQRLPVVLSARSVGVESVGNRFARRWPGTIPSTRFLVPPPFLPSHPALFRRRVQPPQHDAALIRPSRPRDARKRRGEHDTTYGHRRFSGA